MWDVSGTLSALWDDKLKPEQGAEDILKKTFSVYNELSFQKVLSLFGQSPTIYKV